MIDFYSLAFILFTAAGLLLYYTVFRKKQWIAALIMSMVFYLWMSARNLPVLLFTAAAVYGGALLMERAGDEAKKRTEELKSERTPDGEKLPPAETKARKAAIKAESLRRKRIVLIAVLFIAIGILCATKYWNVFANTPLGMVLPLGISFYTFQSIGYLADIYNGKYRAERNFPRFLLFISWFPQLIQGPIGRYDALAPQFSEEHRPDGERMRRALLLILYGLLKKYAVADLLTDPIARILDGQPLTQPGSLIAFAVLLYSAQQYADFSGGIDIITGVSELFGVKLAPNFRQPYFAVSLGDFWRRWHISLGAFMRDYVFYPLALTRPMMDLGKKAGKRFGKHMGRVLPACIANLVVFILVGVWHGPRMHYLVWGLYNGAVIALSDLLEPVFSAAARKLRIPVESRGFHVFRVLRTFFIVNIGWYFDRIEDFGISLGCLKRTFADFDPAEFVSAFRNVLFNASGSVSPVYMMGSLALAAVGTLVIAAVSTLKENGKDPAEMICSTGKGMPSGVRVTLQSVILAAAVFMILGSFIFVQNAGGFLYANF